MSRMMSSPLPHQRSAPIPPNPFSSPLADASTSSLAHPLIGLRESPSSSIRAKPSSRARARARANPGRSPFAYSKNERERPIDAAQVDASPGQSRNMFRQRFRERCEDAMKRDKSRALDRARRKSSTILAGRGNAQSEEEEEDGSRASALFFSDEILGSEDEEQDKIDDELLRRRMLAEYKRMLRAQERSGQDELGWLDADMVAWLHDESINDQARMIESQPQPPAGMEDEEAYWASLYEQSLEEASRGKGSSNLAGQVDSHAPLTSYSEEEEEEDEAFWEQVWNLARADEMNEQTPLEEMDMDLS
ncbi:hypothetical protein IE81DRAFT_39513 [Ceraceosorus guamensis]|uniref:Uncharacterized protein n=1 Tax=Ceraceosorus guamensis TaxID=1522189 RepID=A0A316VNX9_9BASI|nr:hypothetical protein IE81DRAFT_39513 [Ceraceosorus guamensis]PWN39277.1 hypothetical protein IE81DRAFT_39513 [Ceraceosorus guamensis]